MKIIEITCEPILHGGQERFISNLVDNIDDSKFHIDVLTPYNIDNDAFVQTVEMQGGHVFDLGLEFNPGKSRKQLRDAIYEFLKNKGYDVAHIHSGSISALAYSAEAANKAGIKKRIVHSHCTAISSFKHSVIKAYFASSFKKNVTDFLACSYDAGFDKFPSSVLNNHFKIIFNGINIKRFERNDKVRNNVRSFLNADDDTLVIGTVGRLSHQKNPYYLIRIIDEIRKENNNCKLVFVGDGELMEEVCDEVNKLGLVEHVVFVGNVDSPETYYHGMDVFVFPSIYEGFGYAALEAQAAGLPCLISDTVPEDVKICDNVEAISLNDFDKWVDRIFHLKESKITNNGSAIKDAGYDISHTIKQISDIYSA